MEPFKGEDQVVLVRDLYRKTEANATRSFEALVAPEEASIYTFSLRRR